MNDTEAFEELRPLLFAIAYRILGSVTAAQDAVQDTWLRWQQTDVAPTSVKAYLSAAVTRVAINAATSASARRETYPGTWLPEPLLDDPYQDPQRATELSDSISTASLVLLERLSPLERAVFVLRDVFGYPFEEIAETVHRTQPACRQLAARARAHMRQGRRRFDADREQRDRLADRFFHALQDGDVDRLRGLLTADAAMVSDSGGNAPQWGAGIFGGNNVARVIAALIGSFRHIGGVVQPHAVNGQPGAIFRDRDGNVVNTWSLDIVDGKVQAIRAVTNPDKLRHIGPLADASAVLQQTQLVRRTAQP